MRNWLSLVVLAAAVTMISATAFMFQLNGFAFGALIVGIVLVLLTVSQPRHDAVEQSKAQPVPSPVVARAVIPVDSRRAALSARLAADIRWQLAAPTRLAEALLDKRLQSPLPTVPKVVIPEPDSDDGISWAP